MRYNCQALYTLDEVAAQCKAAILKAQTNTQERTDLYTEVRKFYHYDRELVAQ